MGKEVQSQQVCYTDEQLLAVNPYNPDILPDLENYVNEQFELEKMSTQIVARILVKRGMDVCIETTAKTDIEGQKLLALIGMPFREGGGGGQAILQRKKKLKSHHFGSKAKGKARK